MQSASETNNLKCYTIESDNGAIKSVISPLGACIRQLWILNSDGVLLDVVLGYDTDADYLNDPCYMGGVVGRYANRIKAGRFSIDNTVYNIVKHEDGNSLHAGDFHKRVWDVADLQSNSITLELTSKDGDCGFPGRLKVVVKYTIDNDRLRIDYAAETDKNTHVNLTQHSYFNLKGHNSGSCLSHSLNINSDFYTGIDDQLIPTGKTIPVDGSALDFRLTKKISTHLNQVEASFAKGYDHNFVLKGDCTVPKAKAFSSESGITMVVYTDQPGLQFYSGQHIGEKLAGKNSSVYERSSGFCLETQHYPDSPNHRRFPSTLVTPEKPFKSFTEFQFS